MLSVLFAAGTFLHYLFGILMFVVALFLILLVLVQRGRGGGLTGALGGMGGQSAFGTKAGDMFTRVTMVTAGVWILLCMGAIWLLGSQDEWGGTGKSGARGGNRGSTTAPGSVTPGVPSSPSSGTGTPPAPAPSTPPAGSATGGAKPAPAAATPAASEMPAASPAEAPEAPAAAAPEAPKAKE